MEIVKIQNGNETLEIGLRLYDKSTDEGVVIQPWFYKVRGIEPFSKMDGKEVHSHKCRVIEGLIDRCPPLVACHVDYPEQVFGYICCEHQGNDPVLHFMYVRGYFRQLSVATMLMEKCFPGFKKRAIYYTYKTPAVKHLEKKWILKWDPYRVYQVGL